MMKIKYDFPMGESHLILEGTRDELLRLAESLLSQCIETKKGFAKHGVPSGLQVTIDIPILTKWNSI